MDERKKRINHSIGYTIVILAILSIISARINLIIPQDNEYFDIQMFLMGIIAIILTILIVRKYPKFKKKR